MSEVDGRVCGQFLTEADWARVVADPPPGGPDCFCVPVGPAGHHLSMMVMDDEVIAAVCCRSCGGIRGIGIDAYR